MSNLPEKPRSELLLYRTEDGRTRVQVRLEHETVWLTQADMAQLFQTTPQNITIHLKNVFEEGELKERATCKDFLQVQNEGGRAIRRTRRFYNLDAIISVGYRIKSHVATRFRQWATQRLREYIVKGFTLDDERLKQAGGGAWIGRRGSNTIATRLHGMARHAFSVLVSGEICPNRSPLGNGSYKRDLLRFLHCRSPFRWAIPAVFVFRQQTQETRSTNQISMAK